MIAEESHRLLDEAAADSIERIKRDYQGASPKIKKILSYVQDHLFEAGLDATQVKKACGIGDNSVGIQFHSELGRPPYAYIEDRRLETAARLLAETDLKIWKIAELVGYSSIQAFSRSFLRWSGERPSNYRRRAEKMRATRGGPPVKPWVTAENLSMAVRGELPPEQAWEIIDYLKRLYKGV